MNPNNKTQLQNLIVKFIRNNNFTNELIISTQNVKENNKNSIVNKIKNAIITENFTKLAFNEFPELYNILHRPKRKMR